MSEKEQSIFTEEEQTILDKVQTNLLKMTDNIIEKADPKDTRSYNSAVRVVNEVYANVSKNVHDSVKNRLKHEENSNKDATVSIVAELITNLNKQKIENKGNIIDVETPDNLIPDDIVPGETDINPEKLNIEDFVSNDTKE